MAKYDEFSGLTLIDSLDDLFLFLHTNNRRESRIAIKLYDEETKRPKNYDVLNEIANNLESYAKCGLNYVNLDIPYEKLPKQEFISICDFYLNVKQKIHASICVNHRYTNNLVKDKEIDETKQLKWDIHTIIKANLDINRVCDFIKKNYFSPLEALAFIHYYVSNITPYNPSNTASQEWDRRDQFFPGLYQSIPEVVCTGYSALMKEIIDNLKMPGLNCDIIGERYFDRKSAKYTNHVRCYLRIHDKKYRINQSCYDDPTWDLVNKNNVSKYSSFAISNKCHDYGYGNRFIFSNPKQLKIDSKSHDMDVNDFNYRSAKYDIGLKKMNQLTIEKIFFNMLQKSKKKCSCEEIYSQLSKMASVSFEDQTKQECDGYLKSGNLKLSFLDAKQIYDENVKNYKEIQKEEIKNTKTDAFLKRYEIHSEKIDI